MRTVVLIVGPPGAGKTTIAKSIQVADITPAHADQYYWPLATDRTITAWIPLQAVPEDMGPLGFYARSQSESFGRDLGISDESEAKISANISNSLVILPVALMLAMAIPSLFLKHIF